MPKHHVRGPRHSSTHPRPHAHASIHDTPSQPRTSNKRKRINPLNVYTAHDADRTVAGRGGRDRRYDWDSQEKYEYELPDQFVDEEVEEEEAFDETEEDKYGEVVNTIMARQKGGGPAKGQRGGQRGMKRAEKVEEEKEEEAEQDGDGEENADNGGVNEDDELDEGMTTLSAMLDEADEAEDDEQPIMRKGKQGAKQQRAQQEQPSTDLERMMERVKQQMEAVEEQDDMEDEDVEEDVEEEQEAGDEEVEDDEETDGNNAFEEEDDDDDEEEAENEEPDTFPPSRRQRQTADDEEDEDDEEEDEDEDSSSKRAHLLSMIEQLGDEVEVDERLWKRKERSVAATDEAVVEESEYAAIHMPTGPATTAAAATTSSKLTLADLMQSLQGTSAPAAGATTPATGESKRSLAQLKKKLSVLSSTSASTATATLAEPLPDIRQDEITRRLGYTQVKEELERWTPIVERHRDAANLHFPMHALTVPRATSETMAAAFKPTVRSELERDLERIMREYGVKERRVGGGGGGVVEGVEEAALKGRELTEEEMERRRGELSKMKSLLFHHEMKQRRINRIKSKTYRRLRKKLQERSQLTADELQLLDPEEAERRRLKAEVERVKERMTLAHTNRSAWMKRQMRVNANVQSGEVKQALEQSQAIAQRLRRKIDSADGRTQDDSDESEEEEGEEDLEEDDDEQDEEAGKRAQTSKAAQLKAALRAVQEEGSEEEKEDEYVGFDRPPPAAARGAHITTAAAGSGNKSGLLGLKFMQRAMEEKRQQTREAREQLEEELKDELKREVGASDDKEQDEEDERKDAQGAAQQQQQHEVKGKRKLGGAESSLAVRREQLLGAEREERSMLLPGSFQSASVGMSRGKRAQVGAAIDVGADDRAVHGDDQLFEVEAFEGDGDDDGQQPLTAAARSVEYAGINGATSRPSANGTSDSRQQKVNTPAKLTSRYHQQQPAKPQQAKRDDDADVNGDVNGDDNPWAQPTDVAGRRALRDEEQKKRRRKRHKSSTAAGGDTSNSHTNASADAAELDVNSVLLSAGQASAVDEEQQRLVAAAFAVGEDEEKQFADTKAAAISATMPTVEQFTTTLPGWGNWTGEGLKPRPPTARQQREQRETQRKLLAAQQLALNSRRDSSLPHVIVSEQSDKRASRYLLQRLPFPYTSVDAYEQSLLQPLGKEWNAVEAHQKAVRPAVTVTKGAIIEAVTYHDSEKERREAERRDEDKRQRQQQRNETTANGGNTDKSNTSGKRRTGGDRRGLASGKRRHTAPL